MTPLVISDVDGTLVTSDKRLTEASVRAVRRLHERGIGFTITSSRPQSGRRMLVEPLSLRLPLGAFNGAAIVSGQLQAIEQHLVPEKVARHSVRTMTACGADVWVYTTDTWSLRDPRGDYVAREIKSIQTEPPVVDDLEPYLACAAKIVGSSKDFSGLAECEETLRRDLQGVASVACSQPYYLDVTAPGLDKGSFVDALSERLAIAREAIAVFGSMENDLAMFCKAGLSIAMGNASVMVKRQADHLTETNAADGFAKAIARYILGSPASERRA
jgi:Cof subfamily protein (haloacid dehalogenase superfamily)